MPNYLIPLEYGVYLFKGIALIFAFANIFMSYRGFYDTAFGRQRPLDLYRAAIFLLSVGTIAANAAYLFLGTDMAVDIRIFFATMCFAMGMGVATYTNRRIIEARTERFLFLHEHIDVALAIVELDEIAPEEAKRIANECRALVAKKELSNGRLWS